MTIDIAKKALKSKFGYDRFRPMQEAIIQATFDKKDVLVLMPTGGGKSMCYQIPAICMGNTTVVISPLISLMRDQVESLKSNGISAAYMNSSQSSSEQYEVETNFSDGKYQLIYVSPEKMMQPSFIAMLRRVTIDLFAIDEAHCISSWGHDFRPEYQQLSIIKSTFPNIPVMALTATADKLTRKDIVHNLNLDDPEIFIASFDRPNIELMVRPGQKRIEQIVEFIKNRKDKAGIIYCLSRKSTEDIANKLKQFKIKAAFYHAMLSAEEKNKVQDEFLNDNIQVICATIAFGMGIDKSNVRWVIHYNLPKNLESYYQEIGRSGRDGTKAEALLFYSFQDVRIIREMLTDGEKSNEEVQLAKLEQMQHYAEATNCRRAILLNYFSEQTDHTNCGNCDVCKHPPKYFDGTVIVQKALSAIARTNQTVGLDMLIGILRGSARHDILEKGYDKIKTYGAGRDLSQAVWQNYLQQMIHIGLIEIAYDKNYALEMTEASKKILFDGQKCKLSHFEPQNLKETKPKIVAVTKSTILGDELTELLRQLRKELAQSKGIPPYIVFTDATLEDLAKKKPLTDHDLENVHGFGERKVQLYGAPILELIRSKVIENSNEGGKVRGATYVQTLDLLKKGYDVSDIAAERNLSETTIYAHIAYWIQQKEPIDYYKFISKGELERIREAFQTSDNPNEMKPLFERLNGEISYGKLRLGLILI